MSSVTNDRTHYVEGFQGVNLKLEGTSGSMEKDIAIDFGADYGFQFSIYIFNNTEYAGTAIYFRTSTTDWTNYYDFSTGSRLMTGWNNVKITKSSFRATGSPSWGEVNHIKIKMYSHENRAHANATFDNFRALYSEYPAKISFRFDDANVNAYTLGKPILEKYAYEGIAAIPTDSIGGKREMTIEQLTLLQNAGWDIISHTKTHKTLTSLDLNNITYELYSSQKWLLDKGFVKGSRFFVPPSEKTNGTVDAEIAKYYLGCFSGQGYNSYPFPDKYHILSLDVFNVSTGLTHGHPNGWYPADVIKHWIDKAILNDQYISLTIHYVNTTILRDIVDYVHSKNLQVVTLSDLFDRPDSLIDKLKTSGSASNCINGTWIRHGLAGRPTTVTLTISGSNYIDSSSYLLQPTVITCNSTHFQISFYVYNAGTITTVTSTDKRNIFWVAECKP